ncbi:MAG: lipoprotein [Bacteroidota bacterium]
MKKLTFFAVAVIALASCAKERTCTCTTSTVDSRLTTQASPSTSVMSWDKVKTSDARATCASDEYSYAGTYTTYPAPTFAPVEVAYTTKTTSTCELK